MIKLGSFLIDRPTILAPMAGVTDLPFRQICRNAGAGMTVSEMVTADSRLWNSRKSEQRLRHDDNEASPRSVQIAGSDPVMMAEAMKHAVLAEPYAKHSASMSTPQKKGRD